MPDRDVKETVIIFDWDDTLLPTTWLERQSLMPGGGMTRQATAQLRALETSCIFTLQMAMELGTVLLVTNAAPGWIEASSVEFMPTLATKIRTLPIFAKPFNANLNFKIEVFRRECRGFRRCISLGDGPVERVACLKCDCPTKASLKFREQPSLPQLALQHELVQARLGEVVKHPVDLDLRMSISGKGRSGAQEVTMSHLSRAGGGGQIRARNETFVLANPGNIPGAAPGQLARSTCSDWGSSRSAGAGLNAVRTAQEDRKKGGHDDIDGPCTRSLPRIGSGSQSANFLRPLGPANSPKKKSFHNSRNGGIPLGTL